MLCDIILTCFLEIDLFLQREILQSTILENQEYIIDDKIIAAILITSKVVLNNCVLFPIQKSCDLFSDA